MTRRTVIRLYYVSIPILYSGIYHSHGRWGPPRREEARKDTFDLQLHLQDYPAILDSSITQMVGGLNL